MWCVACVCVYWSVPAWIINLSTSPVNVECVYVKERKRGSESESVCVVLCVCVYRSVPAWIIILSTSHVYVVCVCLRERERARAGESV